MIGIAGSGKTAYACGALPGRVYVSMDSHRDDASWPAERRSLIERFSVERPLNLAGPGSRNKETEYILVEDALRTGRSAAVDDMSLTAEIRRSYVCWRGSTALS